MSFPTWRHDATHAFGEMVTRLGLFLLALGVALGWGGQLLERLAPVPPGVGWLQTALASLRLDVDGYLSADLTALAVIIAIVIGFNASLLQVAGQTVSLALTRAILLSLGPFLLCWSVTTGVALAYYLDPPVYRGQLWQLFVWFAAVILLMLGYLWTIPWRLSGEYAATWALGNLRGKPIARWETLDGYSVAQTSFTSATARGDLGATRALALAVGGFLVTRLDPQAERERRYLRDRFRALKNLVTGCAQNVAGAPNAIAYYLGILCGATFLQATAVSAAFDHQGRDLFSGVLRELRAAPERLDPFWTGARHALCHRGIQGEPYLTRYWLLHAAWARDDSRVVDDIAAGLLRLYVEVWRVSRSAPRLADGADDERLDATEMLQDLYRNIAEDLGPVTAQLAGRSAQPLREYPRRFLDALHQGAERLWQATPDLDVDRQAVQRAYEQRRSELLAPAGGAGATPIASTAAR